jgi:hypothetical protein
MRPKNKLHTSTGCAERPVPEVLTTTVVAAAVAAAAEDFLFPNQHSLNELPPTAAAAAAATTAAAATAAAAADVDDGRLLARLTHGAKKTIKEWADQKHVGDRLFEEIEGGRCTLHWQ